MPALITILLDWRTWLAIILVALTAAVGIQTKRLGWAKDALTLEKAERANETASRERIARQMAEQNARLQAEHAARQQETTRVFNDALKAQELRNAALSADADSLRDAVNCYAAGDCLGPHVDTASGGTCKDRAAAVGKLFGRANALAGRMAAAADRHADEVRALKSQILADREACSAERP
jgi:predicted 2-oxoglutarate/Fe(II)-dependent dioxygenase YbiX